MSRRPHPSRWSRRGGLLLEVILSISIFIMVGLAAVSLAMVWSSIAYVRVGALFGFGVLAAGVLVMAIVHAARNREQARP
jgi:uncharacterized membrane protein